MICTKRVLMSVLAGLVVTTGLWAQEPKLPTRNEYRVAHPDGVTFGESNPPVYCQLHCVAFSPGGKTLASGGDDGVVRLWDVAARKNMRTLKGHTDAVFSVAFSPDGKTLASGSRDKTVMLWDVAASENPRTLKGHADLVDSVAFSPDGRDRSVGELRQHNPPLGPAHRQDDPHAQGA